jgi:hypothetical protein
MRTTLFKACIALAFGMCLGARLPAQAQAPPGATQYRQVRRNPIEERLKKLTQELNLDSTQQAKLKTILAIRQLQVRRIYDRASLSAVDRFNAVRMVDENANRQITSILNAEQASKWENLRHPAPPQAHGQAASSGDAR